MKIYKLIIIATLLLTSNWAKSETKVKISTEYGDIVVKLYDQTPKHKTNFIKVINEHYYDSAIFHRVIKNFMIQCGENKNIDMKKYNYLVDAEIVDTLYHKKGVLAAARTADQVNPLRKSSPVQFYIVQGQVFTDNQLNQIEQSKTNENINLQFNKNYKLISEKYKAANSKISNDSIKNEAIALTKSQEATIPKFKFNDKQRQIYKTIGGSPFLDGAYTVFGEVIEGLDVVDKIAAVQTGQMDRPLKDIKMKVTILK